MNVKYYSASDTLTIDLSEAPARGGGEEVAEGVVFSYDADEKLVGIEISGASERVDLTDIVGNPNAVIDDAGPPLTVYTVRSLAEKLGIVPRTLQRTIQQMRSGGVVVGAQHNDVSPIILSEADAIAIRKWREDHPPGRPAIEPESHPVDALP